MAQFAAAVSHATSPTRGVRSTLAARQLVVASLSLSSMLRLSPASGCSRIPVNNIPSRFTADITPTPRQPYHHHHTSSTIITRQAHAREGKTTAAANSPLRVLLRYRGGASDFAPKELRLDPHVLREQLKRTPAPPTQSSLFFSSERDDANESGASFLYWLAVWPRGPFLPEVRLPTFINIVLTTILVVLRARGKNVWTLPDRPHQLLIGTLGFFLSFRASEGYHRCVEARAVWDAVLDRCRDIMRIAMAAEGCIGSKRARRIVDLTCAFSVVLEQYVNMSERTEELALLLKDRADHAALDIASNRPLAVLELLMDEIMDAAAYAQKQEGYKLEQQQLPRLLVFLEDLAHQVTRCDRLMKPPVPAAYYAHSLRFMTLWVFTLPFAIVEHMPPWTMVPAITFITWGLFGLWELGVKAQYPFRAGLVDMRSLFKEVVWDARAVFEAAHVLLAQQQQQQRMHMQPNMQQQQPNMQQRQ